MPWHPGREPVFGFLGAWRGEEIEEALDELRAAGRLRVIRRGPWRGRILWVPSPGNFYPTCNLQSTARRATAGKWRLDTP